MVFISVSVPIPIPVLVLALVLALVLVRLTLARLTYAGLIDSVSCSLRCDTKGSRARVPKMIHEGRGDGCGQAADARHVVRAADMRGLVEGDSVWRELERCVARVADCDTDIARGCGRDVDVEVERAALRVSGGDDRGADGPRQTPSLGESQSSFGAADRDRRGS